MSQKKLIRFKEINSFSNVLQYPENMQGQWKYFFKNQNAIILELACGKGEYTVALAKMYPDKNYIGVEIKGNRLWVGAKKCLDEKITNAAFLRTQIEKINMYFKPGEVSEIWITFPDPQLRFSKAGKRLTHPRFLRLYNQIVKLGGKIHLKTDSPHLYEFTKKVIDLYHLDVITDCNNVYLQEEVSDELKIKTHYESLDIADSKTIFYLCFSLNELPAEKDKELDILLENTERKLNPPQA